METTRSSGPAGAAAPLLGGEDAPEPAFPYYLDGPGGEVFGATPTEYDGQPVVRLVALALPVRTERRDGQGEVTADLAGSEGLVSAETLRTAYLDAAGWALRAGDVEAPAGAAPSAPLSPAARALALALFGRPALGRPVSLRP